jgi:putative transposase
MEQTAVVNRCKYCHSEHVRKYGTYKGIQLYYCNDCKRKFKGDNALFHMKVPAEYVSSALAMYYSGSSIDDIRDFLNQEYHYYPSKHVVFEWVDKYTSLAAKQFQDVRPKLGDTWIADETVLIMDKGIKVWFWDIIDADTRFLIASRASLNRGTLDARLLMEAAYKKAGKAPKEVITDHLKAYLDGVEMTFGADTEHIQGGPFKIKSSGESTSQIERFHGTIKERTKVMRAFRDIETLIQFMDGYLVYYNYFKPNDSLNGKTPAEVAKVNYQIKNWKDLSQIPVSKRAEIETHQKLRYKIIKDKPEIKITHQRIPTLREPRDTKSRGIDLGGGVFREKSGRRHIRL